MTDDTWRMYFADMGGFPASIVFNDGIAGRLNELPLPLGLKLRLPLKAPRGDGLSTQEEAGQLNQLDERLDEIITGRGGEYLGRVTNNGARWVLGLLPDGGSGLEAELSAAAAQAGYVPEVHIQPDPGRSVYWNDLYPSEDDRQVMRDMEVQAVLIEEGDNVEKARQIDHWAYFRDEAAAQDYARWAASAGYQSVTAAPSEYGAPAPWLVRMHHIGTIQLTDISTRSLALLQRARDMQGHYDGWESPVTR